MLAVLFATALFGGALAGLPAGTANAAGPPEPGDNLGALTAWAIHELDFDQGAHSSDPSGDGVGRDGVEDRVGLANIFERGNLQATIDFLADALGQ